MPAGRPTKYNKSLAEKICKRLAEGESLRSICRDKKVPAISTIMLWVVTPNHPFSEQYMRAREAAGYSHADRIVETVEKTAVGEYDPQQARAMMDGLKWAAERMAPKRHSPQQKIDHSSSDGTMTPRPVQIVGKKAESDRTTNK